MKSQFRSLITVVAIAFDVAISSIAMPDPEQEITIQIDAAARQQDTRFDKPVSISARAISLKAVLDQISAQSGIDVKIDERDPASSYSVLAACSAVPAGKLVSALYGLLSLRKGEWAWMRVGKPGAYRYSLHETPWAKNRSETYHRILDGLLTNYLEVVRQLAPMKMEERKLHRDALKKALFLDDDSRVRFYFENEIFWTQARFFLSALTPAQQASVLRGAGVSVALKDLAPEVYDLFHQAYVHAGRRRSNEDGTIGPVPEPDTVGFHQREVNTSRQSFAPAIMISMGNADISWMGTGTLDAGVRSAIERAWRITGDAADDAAGRNVIGVVNEDEDARREREKAELDRAQLIARLPGEVPDDIRRKLAGTGKYDLKLGTALAQMVTGSSMPLLAILPTDENRVFESPVGKSVNDYLIAIEGAQKLCFHKWRDGVLLINHPRWFTDSVSPIPYGLLHRLHPDGFGRAPLAEWLDLMGKISDDQSDWLASNNAISNMKQIRSLLLLTVKLPTILSDRGVLVDDDAVSYLQSVNASPEHWALSPVPVRMRVRQGHAVSAHRTANLDVQVCNEAGQKWIDVASVPLPALRQNRAPDRAVP